MKVELRDIEALLESFQRSSAQELKLTSPQFELRASKRSSETFESRLTPVPQARGLVAATPAAAPAAGSTVTAPEAKSATVPPTSAPEGHAFVRAANLGTFYRAPKPGAPSYVEVGSPVSADTEVCLIEVMKLFTPLVAGIKGVVREILVTDGALVEFEQPLFLVELDS